MIKNLNFQQVIRENKDIHVVDTNIFINFLFILKKAEREVIVIPRIVICELNNISENMKKTQWARRQARKALKEIFQNDTTEEKLIKGIYTRNKCYVCVKENKKNYFEHNSPDNNIISLAVDIQDMNNHGRKVILLSQDKRLKRKAKNKKIIVPKFGKDYFFKRNREAKSLMQQPAFA